MRMWDVALYFTVCLNLAIALCASPELNIFGTINDDNPNYYTQYHDQFIFGDTDFSAFNDSGVTSVSDYATQASVGASMISFIWSLITGFVAIYWTLVQQLHVPAFWAGFYQTIVYIIYALGFFSLITGRHPDATV